MVMQPQPTPYDFGKFTITVTRADGTQVEISNLVIELNFFESLRDPYVSGSLMLLDSANISNFVNFRGQETVNIIVTDFFGAPRIDKTFAITSVNKQEKLNDSASALVLNFIDIHMYLNKKFRFSKKLEGKPEQILQQILSELRVSVSAETSSQSKIRFIAPFSMSPMDIASLMKNRCTTQNGMPFFFHGSLYSNTLSLVSLETLLNQPTYGSREFKYTSVAETKTNQSLYTVENFESLSYRIASISMEQNQDVIKLFDASALGSQYMYVDTIEDKAQERRFRITDALGKLLNPNDGAGDYSISLPENLGDPIHESVTNYVSQITTRKLFENGLFSYNEEEEITRHDYKSINRGLRSFLTKAYIVMQCPGYNFLGSSAEGRVELGKNLFDVYIPKDLPIDGDFNSDYIQDKKRSGKYVITHMRHMFKNAQYSVIVGAVKHDNLPTIDTEQFYSGET